MRARTIALLAATATAGVLIGVWVTTTHSRA
jgi:hypothetical protein